MILRTTSLISTLYSGRLEYKKLSMSCDSINPWVSSYLIKLWIPETYSLFWDVTVVPAFRPLISIYYTRHESKGHNSPDDTEVIRAIIT
jgi:hypothetical protein